MATISIETIKSKAKKVEELAADRNALFDRVEQMYLMDWRDIPKGDHIKATLSPDARNAVQGAVRLLSSAAPKFSIPGEKADREQRNQSDPLERAADAIWSVNSRVHQFELHAEATRSAVLFGMICLGVMSTADLVQLSKGKDPSAAKRVERISKMTPVLIEVYDPRTVYPEFDRLGLASVYRKADVKAGEILDAWGDAATKAGVDASQRDKDLTYCEYWDYVYHAVWIDGAGTLLEPVEHKLPTMPFVVRVVEGSRMHQDAKYHVQPFLYGEEKSGVWQRQNLALTYMYSNLFALAANTQYVYEAVNPDDPIRKYNDVVGGVTVIRQGEKFYPMPSGAVDPNMQAMYEMASTLGQESTIYKQTLGQPLGGQRSFSEVAVLNQAGRLPLQPVQAACGGAFGDAMQIAFELMRDVGGKAGRFADSRGVMELAAKDIPQDLIIECKVDIDLPQDQRMNAQLMDTLAGKGYVSKEWALENLLNIGQPRQMIEDIYAEKFFEMQAQLKMQAEAQKMQMQAQQQMMPQQMGGPQMPPQQTPQPGMEQMPQGGPPPEMMGDGTGAQPGMAGMPMAGPQNPDGMPMGGEMMPPGGV